MMEWFPGSIVEAVKEAKTRNAVFVVFIQGKDDESKKLKELIDDSKVTSKLQVKSNFVAITLESGTEAYVQFAQIYQLVPVPSVFFIGTNGVPLEVIAGGIDIISLISKINNVLAKSGKAAPSDLSTPSNAPSSSTAREATTSFLAGEQSQVKQSSAKAEEVEYEVVCEGDTCVRRPKQKTSPKPTPAPAPVVQESKPEATQEVSSPTLDDKLERAKQLLEKKRKEKEEEEKKAAIQKELERRSQGQGMAELKKWQQEQELKNLKEERLREKQENDRAKQRILEQIAQDKINRAAKFAPPAVEKTTPVTPTASTLPQVKSDDTVTRIQFKMADGSTHLTKQDSNSTLGALRKYVKDNVCTSGAFTLSIAYPRQLLTQDQDVETLRGLGLTPSSTILVLQGSGGGGAGPSSNTSPVAKATGFFAMISQILWAMFVQPTQDIFSYVRNWITGRQAPTAGPSTSSSSRDLGGQVRRTDAPSEGTVKRRKVGGSSGSGVSTIRKEGNTYRLRDNDDDDENNTWNGNSTQQM